MTTATPPPSPSEAMIRTGQIIADHLYSAPTSPVRGPQLTARSPDRPYSRAALAEKIQCSYQTLSQVINGRQSLSKFCWHVLMNGGGYADATRTTLRPALPFTPIELDELKMLRKAISADKQTGYKAEPAKKIVDRWLGWIEEGDELSLTLLKNEITDKLLNHLRQPYI